MPEMQKQLAVTDFVFEIKSDLAEFGIGYLRGL